MVIANEWFTVEEAAEYLRVSKRTIYKLTSEGRLPTFRIGKERHRRFRREDLDNVPQKAGEAVNSLSAVDDPVLAGIWNNDRDAAYDRL